MKIIIAIDVTNKHCRRGTISINGAEYACNVPPFQFITILHEFGKISLRRYLEKKKIEYDPTFPDDDNF